MKNLTLVLITLFCYLTATAQKPQRTEEYVLVLATSKLFSTKVTISLDYGQERSIWYNDSKVRNESGKAASFNSVVDALNYMNGQGWEFVNAYVITISNQNVYHYLMRRKISPRELATAKTDTIAKTISQPKNIYYVTDTEFLGVRDSPDTNSKSISTLRKNDLVELVEETNDIWAKIKFTQNSKETVGYVQWDYIAQKIR